MQQIITGYTGTRHIKPAMDAAVWRSIFGPDNYIINVGNLCAGSMPSINEFTILDGVVSMQGHIGYGTQQTLAVDTCATGFKRIDLVVVRYTHDNVSLIDAMEYMVLKGSEVPDSEVPGPPAHSTGIIDDGATQVDFPLYQINLDGSTVTFTQEANAVAFDFLRHLRDGDANGSVRSITSAEEDSGYALGIGATSLGDGTQASGNYSFAQGCAWVSTSASAPIASGIASHAEGIGTLASQNAAHAEGYLCQATGSHSHAENRGTTASGSHSHAEGFGAVASGDMTHAEGCNTVASGDMTHAEGLQTTASGYISHAGGWGTIAQRAYQTAIGQFNSADTGGTTTTRGNWVLIIGKGTSASARSNAMEVSWNGNTKISGTLTQSSDRRLKDHREYLGEKSIALINSLRPAHFYKDNESQVGLYAQDVEEIDPYRSIVGEMNGFKTVNYTDLIPHLITYCQHLEQRVAELERRTK